jgi:hypothetical protein
MDWREQGGTLHRSVRWSAARARSSLTARPIIGIGVRHPHDALLRGRQRIGETRRPQSDRNPVEKFFIIFPHFSSTAIDRSLGAG